MRNDGLILQLGDCRYGITTESREAASYFRRAYSACLVETGQALEWFLLQQAGVEWGVWHREQLLFQGDFPSTLNWLEWMLLNRSVKQDSQCAAFHAAWAAVDDRVVMLAGAGGSGKSRLALQLLERGFMLGAEDVTFIDMDRLIPFPRAIQLRSDDTLLEELAAGQTFTGYDGRIDVEIGSNRAAGEKNLDQLTILFLDPSLDGAAAQPLTPLDALQRLFNLCHLLDTVTRPGFEALVSLAVTGHMLSVSPYHALDGMAGG
jgi:hypothetical protein